MYQREVFDLYLKVAYYSFQKRKITFLKPKFKANRSFILGYLLLQLLKEMILTLIILEKKYKKLRKYQI